MNHAQARAAGTTPEARVAFVTWRGVPNLTRDDRLAADALASRGVEIRPAVWDDPAVVWSDFGVAVIRSTWDYHLRPGEFLDWIAWVEAAGVRIWNPPSLLRWNMDKRYLAELGGQGIPVIPTRSVARGDRTPLADVLGATGWNEVVVKPAVSASAHRTWRTSPARAASDADIYAELVRAGDVLIQPFLPEILDGEWSLCFIAGTLSHAVLKRPPPGEFRVQSELGGEVVVADPGAAARAGAEEILALVQAPWLYARVDGCLVQGDFVLMELELIEPTLFFYANPEAAERFAQALRA
jgi:hypothetical protein